MAIYPCNDPELVNRIGEQLNVDLDAQISLFNIEGKLLMKEMFLNRTNEKVYFWQTMPQKRIPSHVPPHFAPPCFITWTLHHCRLHSS